MYLNVSVFGIIHWVQERVDEAEESGRCTHTHRYTHHDHVTLAYLRNKSKNTLECECRSNMLLSVTSSMILLT